MNDMPINQSSTNMPPMNSGRGMSQPSKSSPIKLVSLLLVVAVVAGGAVAYMLRGNSTDISPSVSSSPVASQETSANNSVQMNTAMTQEIRITSSGKSVKDIDQDIAGTDMQMFADESAALDQEMKGL